MNCLMKNFTISFQVQFTYEDPKENIARLVDVTMESKNLHTLQKILSEYPIDDDVERNENAKSKITNIISDYFLILDSKGKQVWKDWNFKQD